MANDVRTAWRDKLVAIGTAALERAEAEAAKGAPPVLGGGGGLKDFEHVTDLLRRLDSGTLSEVLGAPEVLDMNLRRIAREELARLAPRAS